MIKMAALKESLSKLGFKDISTYLQSGNVLFSCIQTQPDILEQSISSQIKKDFNLEIPVIVITPEFVSEVIANNPFSLDPTKDEAFFHVTIFSSPVGVLSQDLRDLFESKKQDGEEIIITDKVAYLYCPKGYGNTKLTNTFLESKLKVRATTRNWKTMLTLDKYK